MCKLTALSQAKEFKSLPAVLKILEETNFLTAQTIERISINL